MKKESKIPGLERKEVAYEKKIIELTNNIKVMNYNKKEKGDIYDKKARELITTRKEMVSGLKKTLILIKKEEAKEKKVKAKKKASAKKKKKKKKA